jgi:hypothetical protein
VKIQVKRLTICLPIKNGAAKTLENHSQATVVLQLSKTAQISSIDIGNNGSAFIEVQVGRKASNKDFKVILVTSSFLTPIESRNETNWARVRMFASEKLNGDIAKDKWDQIKVICSQPFNKSTKYCLSFITVHSISEDKKKVDTNNGKTWEHLDSRMRMMIISAAFLRLKIP